MKETPSQKNLFTGTLDLDNEARSVKDNDYVGALNIRNSVSRDGTDKQVLKIRGNERIPFAQPQTPIPSSNKCIGQFENLANRLNYSFIYNSQGAMQIRENNIDNGTVTSVVEHNFGWQDDKYISNIDLVDNKLLLWTDTKPRRINIEKSREDKFFKGNIYLTNTEIANATYTITILDKFNNVLAIAGVTFASPLNRRLAADFLTAFINNNNDLNPLCTATTCQEHIEIEFTNQGYFIIDIQANNGVGTIYVPQNYYFSITDTIIDAGKYPLNCPPRLQIKQDNERVGFNNIERTTWQFATQVIYDDFDESTLSPYSDIAFINCEQRGNYIEIDFTDPRLNNETDLSIISKVRLLARPNNTGKFREIAVVEQSDLWLNSGTIGTSTSNTFRFYNDGQYTVIDDATATLPYSALPIEVVGDKYDMGEENFDNRVGYSKFIENYEAPCITADLTPTFAEIDTKVYELSIIIRVRQEQQFFLGGDAFPPSNYTRGNIGAIYLADSAEYPFFGGACSRNVLDQTSAIFGQQILPENGFIGYLAGTDYFSISRQSTNVQNGTLIFTQGGIIDGTTIPNRQLLQDWYTQYNSTGGTIGDMFSTLTIKGVKKGKYVLRLASHWCSIGDKLGKGSYYDLNKGRLYQQTSTHLRSIRPNINGTYQAEFEGTELIVEIDDNGVCTVSNFSGIIGSFSNPNGKFFLGDYYVEDLTMPSRDNSSVLSFIGNVSGYIVDGNGNTDLQAIRTASRCELVKLTLSSSGNFMNAEIVGSLPNGAPLFSIPTDHNGYFYYKGFFAASLIPLLIRNINYNSILGRLGSSQFFSSKFEGSILLDVLESENYQIESAYSPSVDAVAWTPLGHEQAYIFTTNQNFTNSCRTLVTGKVADANGTGIGGIPVLITRNGRFELTQADGTFSILVYRDGIYGNEDRILDQIIFREGTCSLVTYAISLTNYASLPLTIQTISQTGTYNNIVPYAPLFLNNVVLSFVFFLNRKLKSGGRYNFALFHVDELNRRHALVTNNLEIELPFLTEQRQDYFQNVGTGNSNGVFEFTLNVTTPPPSWADKLYVCRTQDTYYSDFLQFPLFDAKYVVQYDDENSIPIETTFSTFSANEIYLGFTEATVAYKEFNSASLKGWDFQEGDRVRFISKPSGELYDKLYDLPIKAQRSDSTTEFIYFAIDNLDALGEVTAGTLVEVYRPKKELDDNVELYFEIHTCIDIVEVNGQKEYVGLPLKLSTGDTYTRNRTVPISTGVSSNFIEDNSISDNWASRQQDIGRVVVKDTRFGRLIRENAIKFSNQYIPGSKLNGLSRFEPLNEFEYPRQYGAINKLIMVNDNADIFVLLAVCENNCFVVYIKEVIYNDVRGTETVAVADRVLGSFRTLKGDYGTKNPESFAFRDGQIFWWDINRGCFVRYDNNGIDDISSLNTLQYALDINNGTNVISAYDDFYSEFITYPIQDKKDAIGFLSDKRGWNANYSFTPEMLGTSGELILSWKNGEIWVHDSINVPYCNFYGQQFNSTVTFVSKLSPLGLKVAQNMRVKASQVWEALSIRTVPNAMYKQGMLSRLKRGNWKNFEGDFWATILRNINDPRFTNPNEALLRGEPMRGDAFIVELMNDSEDLQSLRMAEMYYFSSENTNG